MIHILHVACLFVAAMPPRLSLLHATSINCNSQCLGSPVCLLYVTAEECNPLRSPVAVLNAACYSKQVRALAELKRRRCQSQAGHNSEGKHQVTGCCSECNQGADCGCWHFHG
jgi:hypothetical protein